MLDWVIFHLFGKGFYLQVNGGILYWKKRHKSRECRTFYREREWNVQQCKHGSCAFRCRSDTGCLHNGHAPKWQNLPVCDEHTASMRVSWQGMPSWAGYLCDSPPDSQTIQLCEKIYHLQSLFSFSNGLYEPIPRLLQLTSVYTGWGHWLNHFKHPKDSPTPKVNRYRY